MPNNVAVSNGTGNQTQSAQVFVAKSQIEKFSLNIGPNGQQESGDFFANATVPLTPPIGQGSYTLAGLNQSAMTKTA